MNLPAILKVAFRALGRNKLRTALTMLGIVIGVGAVIVMVSIGQGAQSRVLDQISSMGSNMLFVMPGNLSFGGASEGAMTPRGPEGRVLITRLNGTLRSQPIAHEHAAEAGRAGRLVMTEGVVAREVLRVSLCRDRHAFVRAHRGRADRGAKLVVHSQHFRGVVRE